MTKGKVYFWLVLTSIFGVGTFSSSLSSDAAQFLPAWGQHALPKVGEALMVAAIISMLVDRYVKRELVADVAKDISPYVVGYMLPDEVKAEIRSLLAVEMVRRNFAVTYKFTPLPQHPGYYQLESTVEYEVENLTDRPFAYVHGYSVEKSSCPQIGESKITEVGMSGGTKPYSLKHGDPDLRIKDSNEFIEFARTVKIPKAPHKRHVFWSGSIEVVRETDSCPISVICPTIAVSMTVDHPDDLLIDVSFVKGPIEGDVERIPPERPRQWLYRGVFLPGQHVHVKWRKGTPSELQETTMPLPASDRE